MKLGIAGAGKIVDTLFSFIHEIKGIELQAIASTPKSIDKVRRMAKEQGIQNYYSDCDELIADPEVEVLYVAVPNHLHFEICRKALLAGKHVICEKPFTSNLKELEVLNQLAEEKKLLLLEAISNQYLPNVLKIREMLPEVGDVKIVTANYSQYSSRYDDFKKGIIQPAFDVRKSGGALMDLNIYNIALIIGWFGRPQSVSYHANIEHGIDTSGILILDYDSFKASLIGAKDCAAPLFTCIQGDKACISTTSPTNTVQEFVLTDNKGNARSFDLQGGKHRMYYEFVEFEQIFEDRDYDRAREMMKQSLDAMWVLTEARKSAGIIFPADEQ